MTRVAVATTSQLAADAAAEIASLGGNAVDCGLAAALLSINTEPGVCALAGGAYVTVWSDGGDPVTIDGNVAVPGSGRQSSAAPSAKYVTMEYGGGIETMIGSASTAVPGTLAALELAWQHYGTIPWRDLLAPSIRATRDGFPLSAACHQYLQYSGKTIFGNSDEGFAALHDNGSLKPARSLVAIPALADSLAAIADEGARVFYEGEIAHKIAAHVAERDGLLTLEDLRKYRAISRQPLSTTLRGWTIASNPPPAVGGAVLSALLRSFADETFDSWDRVSLRRLIRLQHAVLSWRLQNLDFSNDVERDAAALLALAARGRLLARGASASTVHTSAVDDTGLACAVTASSGYGSGEMPAGTGLWLNNCVGELELNRRGMEAGPPGDRLPSNMCPSVARCGDRVLAAGSPGADRITTALHQFFVNFIQLGKDLTDAVAHPRLHVDFSREECRVACEPGLDVPEDTFPVVFHAGLNMYFGGVAAALFDRRGGFAVAADPRREGATFVGGA
jgi:gamma-glutamyltranspeptidase / glutathione hydrolase